MADLLPSLSKLFFSSCRRHLLLLHILLLSGWDSIIIIAITTALSLSLSLSFSWSLSLLLIPIKLISELNYKSPRVQVSSTSVPLQPSTQQQELQREVHFSRNIIHTRLPTLYTLSFSSSVSTLTHLSQCKYITTTLISFGAFWVSPGFL